MFQTKILNKNSLNAYRNCEDPEHTLYEHGIWNWSTELKVSTVIVLKFWLHQVPVKKCLDKQCRPRSDCFWRSSLIWVFPVCYSDKHFVNCSPEYQHFIWEQKEKSVQSFRTFTIDKVSTQFIWVFPSGATLLYRHFWINWSLSCKFFVQKMSAYFVCCIYDI